MNNIEEVIADYEFIKIVLSINAISALLSFVFFLWCIFRFRMSVLHRFLMIVFLIETYVSAYLSPKGDYALAVAVMQMIAIVCLIIIFFKAPMEKTCGVKITKPEITE